ncbi:hypothetical protein [Nakamurella aerolata]|uniref:Uncharacterized protein n=1 Tax=Nakamurella aerolata TaxID=1656892 RepID=A0A849A0Q1_9ACTN|nr:hypothetical protein [Nakamurella aerolata]NNG34165.1 hypothetical protein [Nakamurella aerolata]
MNIDTAALNGIAGQVYRVQLDLVGNPVVGLVVQTSGLSFGPGPLGAEVSLAMTRYLQRAQEATRVLIHRGAQLESGLVYTAAAMDTVEASAAGPAPAGPAVAAR